MSCNAAPFALPMWLDGHSFLNIPDVLIDVFRPSDGGLRLRLPRCGSAEMHLALDEDGVLIRRYSRKKAFKIH